MSLFERAWKYTLLGASSIVTEETNPILGGIAVRHGRAGVFGIVLAVTLGTLAASLVLYAVGRWRIDWVRRRWPQRQKLLDGALEVVRRHPWRASLAIRFAYGLRLPLPIACGAARLPVSLFAIAAGISCLVWSALFTWLGYVAGGAALRLLHFTERLDVRLGVVAVVLMVVLGVIVRRRITGERTASVLAGEEISLMTTAERRKPGWRGGRGE